MKKLIFGLCALTALWQAAAADLQWMTDLPKAQQKAKAENKMVLLDFTGSDWCPWCWKLRDEVFATPQFKEYAAKNLVPVEVDFPHKKKLPAEQQKANKALQEKYAIEGYPTVVVLNSQGKEVGKLGYQPGGPKPFINKLEQLKSK